MKKMMIRLVCSLLAASAAHAIPQDVKLALNWKPEPQFGGFYAADLGGEYAKHGLKVNILEGGSGTPTVQMLANGQVDYAIVSGEEILIANERNPKNRVIALFTVYQKSPAMIMCHAEKKFTSLKDVFAAPVTVAWQGGLSYAQYLKKKYPDAKAKFVPYLGGVTNFLADPEFCQQGFFTSEPLSAAKAGVKTSVFLVSDEGFNPYTTVLAVRESVLDKNPAQARSLVEAVRAGWVAYLKNPEATNKKMQALNPAMDSETFQKSAEAQKSLIETRETKKSGLGVMQKARWATLTDQLKDLGVLEKKEAPEKAFRSF